MFGASLTTCGLKKERAALVFGFLVSLLVLNVWSLGLYF